MAILKAAYPQYYKDYSKDDAIAAVNLWSEMFVNDDVNLVKAAVKALIATDTKGFPPVIGQVREKMYQLTNTDSDMTEEEAWQMVKNACRYYDPEKYFNELPEILKKLVGSPNQLREWSQADLTELETVIKSNFIRSYKAKLSNNKQRQMYTDDIRALADKIKATDELCGYDKKQLNSGDEY